MKSSTKKSEEDVKYVAEVTRAKEISDGVVAFNLKVNGVSIYGCFYREYTSKEGKEGTMITFPSHKGNDGKYYSYAFFPMSTELKKDIEKQLAAIV